ncbi:MAG: hypothetical protein CYG59_04620 [Chloroflexi bacterium]|nr:MAG: hypothetical protein CYG59_04620 [Chloroflexota bacterium]
MNHQVKLAMPRPARSFKHTSLHVQLAVIGVGLLIGGFLRLFSNSQPFSSSDHAELAAIVSFFYPRNLSALQFSSSSTWQLLTNAHGILPPLIGMAGTTIVGIMGLPVTEFWWNFPFVLVQLLTIPLAAVLVTRLAGCHAGGIAALLVALLPIHAALSRASGLSHIPLTFATQLTTIICFVRYFQAPTSRNARFASFALTVNLLVELFFPLLFVLLLGIGVLTVGTRKPSLMLRLNRTRALLFVPRVMIVPLLVVSFNFLLLIGYINGWWSGGGIATRLLEGSDRKSGIYFAAFWQNTSYVVGPIALVLLIVLGLPSLSALRRLEARSVPLLWSFVYLMPFVLFTRPHVYEYMLLGLAPLTLNAAIVLGSLLQRCGWQRWLAGLAMVMLLGLFSLRSLSMVFGVDILPAVGTGQAPGGLFPDQGLKAAAWWVRTHMPQDALVFADSTYEPYQIAYYTHRPFLAVTDAEEDESAYRLLENSASLPSAYLVTPGNERLLARYSNIMPVLAATVVVDQRPVLLIYTHTEQVPETIQAKSANEAFDNQFGYWRTMFSID